MSASVKKSAPPKQQGSFVDSSSNESSDEESQVSSEAITAKGGKFSPKKRTEEQHRSDGKLTSTAKSGKQKVMTRKRKRSESSNSDSADSDEESNTKLERIGLAVETFAVAQSSRAEKTKTLAKTGSNIATVSKSRDTSNSSDSNSNSNSEPRTAEWSKVQLEKPVESREVDSGKEQATENKATSEAMEEIAVAAQEKTKRKRRRRRKKQPEDATSDTVAKFGQATKPKSTSDWKPKFSRVTAVAPAAAEGKKHVVFDSDGEACDLGGGAEKNQNTVGERETASCVTSASETACFERSETPVNNDAHWEWSNGIHHAGSAYRGQTYRFSNESPSNSAVRPVNSTPIHQNQRATKGRGNRPGNLFARTQVFDHKKYVPGTLHTRRLLL